jgi:hypothetical protein
MATIVNLPGYRIDTDGALGFPRCALKVVRLPDEAFYRLGQDATWASELLWLHAHGDTAALVEHAQAIIDTMDDAWGEDLKWTKPTAAAEAVRA